MAFVHFLIIQSINKLTNQSTNPQIQRYFAMGKMKAKKDLPVKVCASCNRPFSWRKKWEKVWQQVKYCSERCRNQK